MPLDYLWSRPQISRPASPATLQVPNVVLFGAKSGKMGRVSDMGASHSPAAHPASPSTGRPYAEHMALEVSASRTLATACGSYARALGFTQVPPSLRWGRDTCLVTPHLTPHIPATGAAVAALRADDSQHHLRAPPWPPPRPGSSGAPRPSRHARPAVRGAVLERGASHLTAAQRSSRSFLHRYVARYWGRQLLLALAAAHKYGLRLRTLSARQVHRAATQPLSNSAITLP